MHVSPQSKMQGIVKSKLFDAHDWKRAETVSKKVGVLFIQVVN